MYVKIDTVESSCKYRLLCFLKERAYWTSRDHSQFDCNENWFLIRIQTFQTIALNFRTIIAKLIQLQQSNQNSNFISLSNQPFFFISIPRPWNFHKNSYQLPCSTCYFISIVLSWTFTAFKTFIIEINYLNSVRHKIRPFFPSHGSKEREREREK